LCSLKKLLSLRLQSKECLRTAQNSPKNAQLALDKTLRKRLKQCIFALLAPPNFALSFEVAIAQPIFSFKKSPTLYMVIHSQIGEIKVIRRLL